MTAVVTRNMVRNIQAATKARREALSPYHPSKCRNCAATYKPTRSDQRFCSSRCTQEAGNREMLRGRLLYLAAAPWRAARGTGKADEFRTMCRLLDRWAKEDREAGRPMSKSADVMSLGDREPVFIGKMRVGREVVDWEREARKVLTLGDQG